MSRFSVQTEQLVSASTSVSRSIVELDAAGTAVAGTAGAAAGTPAASAYDALAGDAGRAVEAMQASIEGLSGALSRAAANYVSADQWATGSYLHGAR